MNISPERRCENCNEIIPENAKFCLGCGKAISSNTLGKTCPSCGTINPDGGKFCKDCGAKLLIVCECGNAVANGVKFCPECGKQIVNNDKKEKGIKKGGHDKNEK
jgi:rRNA maturation endonuclease Nob1